VSEEIEKKIQRLADIRRDVALGQYLNPFKAFAHIIFLLALIDDLTEALFKIHELVQEGRKIDSNIDPGNKQSAGPLPS